MTTYYAQVPFSGVVEVKFSRADFDIDTTKIAVEIAEFFLRRGLNSYNNLESKCSDVKVDKNSITFTKPYPTCLKCGGSTFEISIIENREVDSSSCEYNDEKHIFNRQAVCKTCGEKHDEKFVETLTNYIANNCSC